VTARQPLFTELLWNAQADSLLGVQSDRAVARILGVNRITVGSRRKKLGIPPWVQPKRQHQRHCAICGEPFTVVGGRLSQMRTTCPPPKKCQAKLIKKLLALESPRIRLKRIQGLLERHVLRDKDD
jgi:hypothetical protein